MLVCRKGASLLIDVFCAYFGEVSKSSTPAGKAAIVFSSGNKRILEKLAAHAEKYPILGKKPQIEALHVFLKMSKSDLRDKTIVRNLIKLIYQNSPDRIKRKRTLDEILLEVEKFSFDT